MSVKILYITLFLNIKFFFVFRRVIQPDQELMDNLLNFSGDEVTKDIFKYIDQHLARHFVYDVECLSSPPPFLCSQIITIFLNSMISIN